MVRICSVYVGLGAFSNVRCQCFGDTKSKLLNCVYCRCWCTVGVTEEGSWFRSLPVTVGCLKDA